MSDPNLSVSPNKKTQGGPNLTLIYALIALAMLAAIAVAALVILPFYNHR